MQNLSLIFLINREITPKDKETLGPLFGYIYSHIIWSKDFLFDIDSAYLQLKDKPFLESFKSKTAEFTRYDPTLYKYIEVKAFNDQNFQDQFIKDYNMKKMYTIIGEDWLDWRYYSIAQTLTDNTINSLTNGIKTESEFCIKTGLAWNKNKLEYFHPLFEYFMKQRMDISKLQQARIDVSAYLTGQELRVFNILKDNNAKVVTRDDIAKIMWQEEWSDKYSDWSIDKVISNLKKKLAEHNEDHTVKTYKREGFMLIGKSQDF